MENFQVIAEQIKNEFNGAFEAKDRSSYEKIENSFDRFEAGLRERIQALTTQAMTGVVKKIKSGGCLDEKDTELVRLWVLGDAESYVKAENNFNDWLSELQRIVAEISVKTDAQPDAEKAFYLRGLLQDGQRLVEDIVWFLEKKERVARFIKPGQTLDPQERELLARYLIEQIQSPGV